MSDSHNLLEVGDIIPRVADTLYVDGFGLVIDQVLEVLWFVAIDKLGLDTETGKEDFELIVGTAVEV